MKKAICMFVAVLFLASLSIAQENMGARPIGMGGAFTGLADDVNALFLNPAGIGYLRGKNASVSTKLTEGTEYTIIGGVENTRIGSIGIGYIGSSAPYQDPAEGTYADSGDELVKSINQTLVLSYARELNQFMVVPEFMGRLSLGSNLKLSSLRKSSAKGLSHPYGSAVNMDLAAVFRANEYLSYGINFRNFFDKEVLVDGSQSETGLSVAFGISGKVFDKALTWSAEGRSVGVEWKPIGRGLALRAGKDGDYNTAGFGINVSGFGVDYGYMEREEAPIHYVAVSITIDPLSPEVDLKQASLGIE